jgi:anaerobic selenocysteine-containing dehydrogenase
MIPIAGFYPPSILPAEIDTDHPDRIRGLVVDSANPAVSGADSKAYRKALTKLELLVVIDTAFSETAELAHYVLPAASQFEKYECTFFNWGFPENHLHVRHPVLEPLDEALPEQEIYSRLLSAMNEDLAANPLLGPITQLKEAPRRPAADGVPRLRRTAPGCGRPRRRDRPGRGARNRVVRAHHRESFRRAHQRSRI